MILPVHSTQQVFLSPRLSPARSTRTLHQKRNTTRCQASSSDQNVFEKGINALQVALLKSPLNEGKKRFFKMLAGDYDEVAVNKKIRDLVTDNKVVVFSWSVCPFAQRAQRVLREAGAKFVAIELDQVPDGKAIKAELGFLTGRTSVPSVWINGECIGGCNDGNPGLLPLKESGRLEGILREAGSLL